MWIVIQGTRYNFNLIESYHVVNKVLILVSSLLMYNDSDIKPRYEIEYDEAVGANDTAGKLDILLGTRSV